MVISISIVEQLGQLIAFEVIVCIEIPNGCFVERFAGVAGYELDRVTQGTDHTATQGLGPSPPPAIPDETVWRAGRFAYQAPCRCRPFAQRRCRLLNLAIRLSLPRCHEPIER